MALQLTDPSKTYEITHESGAIFTLRHWTLAMQDEVDSKCLKQADGKLDYDAGLERDMKLRMTVVGWTGVEMDGSPVPCTPDNVRLLPPGVAMWLIKDIDERAGLRMKVSEKKN